jgi:hypothetical protein
MTNKPEDIETKDEHVKSLLFGIRIVPDPINAAHEAEQGVPLDELFGMPLTPRSPGQPIRQGTFSDSSDDLPPNPNPDPMDPGADPGEIVFLDKDPEEIP